MKRRIQVSAIGDSKAADTFWTQYLPRGTFEVNNVFHPNSTVADWYGDGQYQHEVPYEDGMLSINLGHHERIFDNPMPSPDLMNLALYELVDWLRVWRQGFNLIVVWAVQPWDWQSFAHNLPRTIAIPEYRVLNAACDYADRDPDPPRYGLHPNDVGCAKMAAHFATTVLQELA